VYLTAPDYLGNCLPIGDLAAVCHRHGALLLVDNAHGAYLKFLPDAAHPIDLGADMCCDSAHKTLPVLTGGAYLHIAPAAPTVLDDHAKVALALFGSTSPSYLILQSLDAANRYLEEYPARLAAFASEVQGLKTRLLAHGFSLCGDEVLKLTLATKPYGWDGRDFAAKLRERGIECEFADPDFVVMMLTPEVGREGLRQLETALCVLPKRNAITTTPPRLVMPKRVMSIREAMLSPCEVIPASESAGRVLAAATVGCPPAVPIVVSGERIDEDAVRCFAYYGIDTCTVVKES
jgi:arginine/lysine/ornithine decarboxylase